DTAGKLFITIDRVNGSLGPVQMTLGTNTFSSGPGSATSKDFGLILPDVRTYLDIYDNNLRILPAGNYSWRRCDGYYGFNNAIQPTTDSSSSTTLNLTILNNTTALQNLLGGLSEANITA